jgi:hypothetical protein
MELDPAILEKGTDLLLKQLQELIAQSPDLGTIHNAFQAYSTNRYSLGSSANTVESGGKGDLGIDFYSSRDRRYVVGQCKVPAQDYLEANPSVPKIFGPSVVNDPRDALQYLFGESTAKPNDVTVQTAMVVDFAEGGGWALAGAGDGSEPQSVNS